MGLFNIDKLKNDLEGYIETKIALLKLEVNEQIALALGKIAVLLVIVFFLFFGVLFLSIAAAFKLNLLLDSAVLGFLIVAGFYLLLVVIFWLFIDRNKISSKLSNKIREEVKNAG